MATVHDFTRARRVLDDAISARAFPCAVAEVGRSAVLCGRMQPAGSPMRPTRARQRQKRSSTSPRSPKCSRQPRIALASCKSQKPCSRSSTRVSAIVPAWSTEDRACADAARSARALFRSAGAPPVLRDHCGVDRRSRHIERAICARTTRLPAPHRVALQRSGLHAARISARRSASRQPLDEQFARWRTASVSSIRSRFDRRATGANRRRQPKSIRGVAGSGR